MSGNYLGKATAWTASAFDGMRRGIHNTRQEGRVAELEQQIDLLTYEIGSLTVLGMDGVDVEEPLRERFARIGELRDQVLEAKAGERHVVAVCPKCGKRTVAGMTYCGYCGAEL